MSSPNNALNNTVTDSSSQKMRTRIKLSGHGTGNTYIVNLDPSRRYCIAHPGLTSGLVASTDIIKVTMSKVRGTALAWTDSADEEDDTEVMSPSGIAVCIPPIGTAVLVFGILTAGAVNNDSLISISVMETIEAGTETKAI